MRKILIASLIILILASTATAETIENYILPISFGFYNGSAPMSSIKSITFTREPPDIYDEVWNADLADMGYIKGYRVATDVYIVGNYIYANPKCFYMFAASNSYGDPLWSSLTEINGLELLDTSYVEDMEQMFARSLCTELNGISKWNVSNVKTFAGMFQGGDHSGDMKLSYLDIRDWNTSSAENMSHMFYGCGAMTYIPIENWDVRNVTTFSHMFADCYNLQSINLSNWETLSAISFDAFLNDCKSLKEVDVSGLDTATCTQFSQMFESCTNLKHIYGLENWDVSNASTYAFSEMFHRCYELEELDLSSWKATPDNMARMFKDCRRLIEIDISGLKLTGGVVDEEMFDGCENLVDIALLVSRSYLEKLWQDNGRQLGK